MNFETVDQSESSEDFETDNTLRGMFDKCDMFTCVNCGRYWDGHAQCPCTPPLSPKEYAEQDEEDEQLKMYCCNIIDQEFNIEFEQWLNSEPTMLDGIIDVTPSIVSAPVPTPIPLVENPVDSPVVTYAKECNV